MTTDFTGGSDTLVVVLAGGQSARFGNLGRLIPKGMLPVSKHQTLLTRNLDHLYACGLRNVTVTTSPETYDLLSPFIDKYRTTWDEGENHEGYYLELICNQMHKVSSLAALNEILARRKFRKYVMCFADIYFKSNPFSALMDCIRTTRNANFIAGFPKPNERDIARGGLMISEGGLCKRLYLTADELVASSLTKPLSWPGVTLFDSEVASDLSDFLRIVNTTVEEDFINFSIDRGRLFSVFSTEHFVNVNCYSDYLNILEREDDALAKPITNK